MRKFFPFLILVFTSFQSIADTPYVGIDYMQTNIEVGNEDVKPKSTALRLGVSNNNMAFEAQYLIANSSDNIYNIDFDLDKSLGIYFVMQSDKVNGFGVDVSIGYAMTDINVSGPQNTYNGDDSYDGFSWRISLHQQLPYIENAQATLSYQSLYKDSNIEVTGLALGITYHF